MIPHANPLQTFVVPNTGHALNAVSSCSIHLPEYVT